MTAKFYFYITYADLIGDLTVPMSEHRAFKYFKEESLKHYAEEFGWQLIDNKKLEEYYDGL